MNRAGITLVVVALGLALLHLLLPIGPLIDLHRSDPATARLLLTELRLPRTLLALGYGAVLGLTGASLQALFANPLASPDITGSSSGAALGAVLASYWLGLSSPIVLAACGGAGALVALALLLLLAGRGASGPSLLLAGLAISLAAGAATSLVLALAPSPFAFYDSFEWLMGSFVDRSLPQAVVALLPASVCGLLLLRRGRALDLMALGEDVVSSLGYRPRRIALEVVTLSSITVGSCVSVCGAIGFVGLIAPFAGRLVSRGHPGRAQVPAAIIGGALLVLADLAVRMGPAGRTIPVGVLTTVAGTPLFVWIVVRARQQLVA